MTDTNALGPDFHSCKLPGCRETHVQVSAGDRCSEHRPEALTHMHKLLQEQPEKFLGATVHLHRPAYDGMSRTPEGRMVTTVTGVDLQKLRIIKGADHFGDGYATAGWEGVLLTPHGECYIYGGGGRKECFNGWMVVQIKFATKS